VDDCGPEDGTKEAVEDFAKKFPDHRILYHRHKKNAGVSAARNTAISLAGGENLAFLDPDDWWEVNYLEAQICAFDSDSSLAVVYTGTNKVDERGVFLEEWSPPEHFDRAMPEGVYLGNYINPSGVVATRSSVAEVGGFDITPELQHVEDWDLWIKLAMTGYCFKRSAAPLVNYRQHSGAAGADREKLKERTFALMCKHGASPIFMRVLLGRWRAVEEQLDDAHVSYRKLLAAHNATLDRRIKKILKSLFRAGKAEA
jgi:glycosyltransferase involved in cell wall biosynthesis